MNKIKILIITWLLFCSSVYAMPGIVIGGKNSGPNSEATLALTANIAITANALSTMNISQFTNDSSYLTSYSETDPLVKSYAKTKDENTLVVSEANVALNMNAEGLSGAITVLSNGNVGIGTTTPGSKLAVNGDVTATSFSGSGASLTALAGDNISDGTIDNSEIQSNAAIAFSKLDIDKADITGLGIPASDTNTQLSETTVEGYIANDTSTGYVPYDNGSKLTNSDLYYNGANVGIGTTAPGSKLAVNGDVTATSFSGSGASLTALAGDNISDGTIDNSEIQSNAAIAFSKLDIDKADITGLGIPASDTNTQLSEATVEGYIANDTSTGYVPYDNGSKLTSSGLYYNGANVGIGTTAPGSKLAVNGDVTATSFSGSGASLTALAGDNISDGTIDNSEIQSNAAIAWSKISKTGAVASDVGAQSSDADLTDLADGTLSKEKVEDSNNWDTAYTDRNNWNGGATGLIAGTGRTSLGLGSLATLSNINNAYWSGTDLAIINGGTGASTAAAARTSLGLAIGSNIQAYDLDLADLADGTLSGSKVGSGISASNISAGTLGTAYYNSLSDLGGGSGTTFLRKDGTWATPTDTDTDTNTHLSEATVEGYIANDTSTGYVPYDNGSKLTNSGLYYNGTNVGIGTTAPVKKLEVRGGFEVRNPTAGGTFGVFSNLNYNRIYLNGYNSFSWDNGNTLTIGDSFLNITLGASVQIEGTLSKYGGTFDIKHPDPDKEKDGWRLRHSFVESPTRGDNLYRWNVTVEKGKCVIILPNYYKYLNENTQVWVSAKGHFGQAYGEINEALTEITITANADGKYNVLAVGTRKDKFIKDFFDKKGVEYQVK